MRIPFLLLWALLTLFIGLGSYSLYIVDEARNAQAAWEMYANGEWIVPTFNGQLRTDKPPLHYYSMRLTYAILGKNALAARLVSALLGISLLALLFQTTKRYLTPQAAPWTVAILLASFYFPLQMRLATPDPYLIFFFTLAMLGLWAHWQSSQPAIWLTLGTYLALGLAALAKGPVAVGLTGLAIIVFLLWERQFSLSAIRRFRPFWGLVIGLVVTLPWLWAVHVQTEGAWTNGFFLEHNLERFSSAKEGHGGGFWLILLLALVSMLPFSLLLPLALGKTLEHTPPQRAFLRFCGSIVLVVLAFFMLSRTKLPSYPAPAYPFLALVLAPVAARLAQNNRKLPLWIAIMWGILALAIPLGLYFSLPALAVDLPRTQIVCLFPIPLVVGLGCWWLYHKRTKRGLFSVALGFGLLSPLMFACFFPRIDRQNHVQESLPLLASQEVVVYQRCSPSYIFYTPGPLPVYQDTSSLGAFLRQDTAVCPLILSTHYSEAELATIPGIQLIFRQRDLFENLTTVLYRYEKEPCR